MRIPALIITAVVGTTSLLAQAGHDHDSGHAHKHDADDAHHDEAGLGTHVHGEAELLLALEGQQLQMQFNSPAANLLGFEYMPRTDEEKHALSALTKALAIPGALFNLPTDAHCEMTDHQIGSSLLAEAHDHDDHGHSQHEHDDDKHAEEAHAEFDVRWTFNCSHPEKLNSINAELFDHYSGLEKISAQWISETGQGGATLTPEQSRLHFK